MNLLLLEIGEHPGEIAATKIGACTKEGTFFLDFSRPLATERWFGVWNFRFGVPLALHVPVIHEGESVGLRSIAVERSDAYFGELQRLWRSRHPKATRKALRPVQKSKVDQDFQLQFPTDVPKP